jgi:hypothetical protein
MEADLARRRWNSFVIISGESLQAPVGHLRGDQFFSEKTFIDSQRQSSRTHAMSLTHHSLMKTFAESLQTSCWENAKNHPWKLAEIRRHIPTFFPTLTESRMINPVIL